MLRPAILATVIAIGGCTRANEGGTEAPAAKAGVDPDDADALSAALAEGGLRGWMHAVVPEHEQYVWTYRQPGNFFASADVSLVPATAELRSRLAALSRHDRVWVRGELKRRGGQLHLALRELRVDERYASAGRPVEGATPWTPRPLADQGDLLGKVHAVAPERGLLVVELGQRVLPLLGADHALLTTLQRNDKVRVHYRRQQHEGVDHLFVDASAGGLEVLDRVAAAHGETVVREGQLVRYPKSPQIIFDIYALQVVDADDVRREYTLVNFEDAEAFAAIREHLGKLWAAAPSPPLDGRNKQVQPGVRLRIRGVLNQKVANQANPQLLLQGPEAIEALDGAAPDPDGGPSPAPSSSD